MNKHWRESNPEKAQKARERWTDCNPERVSYNKKINNARRRLLIGSFTEEEWDILLDYSKGICPCCDKYIGKEKLTLDHKIPVSWKESTNYISNIQPLCMYCNSKKSNHHATDYIAHWKLSFPLDSVAILS